MTTGRVFAASPRSASQISPGWGFIEQVEDVLFGGARARYIQDVVSGQLYNLSDAFPGLCRTLGYAAMQEGSWTRSNFFWATSRFKRHEKHLGGKQRLQNAVHDRIGIEPNS
jgi:hypothetical protein